MRQVGLLGAASGIGIRPYDDGGMRRLDLAPAELRKHGVGALASRDYGDIAPSAYRDFQRIPGKPRNESGVANYSNVLADRMAEIARARSFVLLLGGDCSIVLGALLGARRAGFERIGLVYIDAHGDFATPETSRSGSAASMCLALAAGVGDTPLARLAGSHPLVRQSDIVIIGRRDDNDPDPWYGQDVITKSPMLDVPDVELRRIGVRSAASRALERVTATGLDGFWIHVDADVVNPDAVPAVDSPEPGGLGVDELAELISPLAQHRGAIGMELTIYDPQLDPDHTSARNLVTLLTKSLDGGTL